MTEVGGKVGVRRKLQQFFILFLGVTYSHIFEKRGYRSPKKEAYVGSFRSFWLVLPIAVFFKNAAIGPLSKTRTWEASKYFWVLPIAVFFEKRGYRSSHINFFKADL